MKKNASQQINVSEVTSELLKSKAYIDAFPEYYELATITENSLWHDNQNVLDHVIGVFKGLEQVLTFENISDSQKVVVEQYLSELIGTKTRQEILKVATLLHDIAKIDTLVKRPDGTAGCPGHELIAAGRIGNFSVRFGLNEHDERYAERIVRYHGFISEILNLMLANKQKDKYQEIFKKTVGDVAIELVLLMRADLLGSDLEKGDRTGYQDRVDVLAWMLDELIGEQKA